MRSASLAGLLALLSASPLLPGERARAARPSDARASSAAHLQVIEVEYRLMLSRGTVSSGRVDLEAIDRGMDPHDLRLRAQGASIEIVAPQLSSGQRWDGTVRLRPGVYRLWCSLPEHARLGMHATLRVTP